MLSCFSQVQLLVTPCTIALQAPLSMGFSRQEYWSGLPCPLPGVLPNSGIKHVSLRSPALAGRFFFFFFFFLTTSPTWEAWCLFIHPCKIQPFYNSKYLLFIPYCSGFWDNTARSRHSFSLLGACIPAKEQIIHKYNMWSMLWRKIN